MLIDARGLVHPDHIKAFKQQLEDFCTVHDDVDVLLDDNKGDVKKFEMYVRSCRAEYTIDKEDGHLRLRISGPFSMCG